MKGDDKVLVVARLAGSLAIRTAEIVIYPMTRSSPPESAAFWLIREHKALIISLLKMLFIFHYEVVYTEYIKYMK